MQGLQLGKGMVQAVVGAILDIVPPFIPPPVRGALGLKAEITRIG
jgi:hypothetical protein